MSPFEMDKSSISGWLDMGELKATSEALGNRLLFRRLPADWEQPMLAMPANGPVTGPGWIYERKFDGVRCLGYRRGDQVRLSSRNQKIVNRQYPELVRALLEQPVEEFIVDGEIVALEGNADSFARLQHRLHVEEPGLVHLAEYPVYYYLFDLLYVNGYDLTRLPLELRKSLLEKAFEFQDPVRRLEYCLGDCLAILAEACEKGWEGIVAKRLGSPYEHGRSKNWLKFKCVWEQEFVIGGYTLPKGSRLGLGALLVGYYEGNDLIFAGKVGSGFDEETLSALSQALSRIETDEQPFAGPAIKEKDVRWVWPKLVAMVAFSGWTDNQRLWQPRFLGLRKDKNPQEVVREGSTKWSRQSARARSE